MLDVCDGRDTPAGHEPCLLLPSARFMYRPLRAGPLKLRNVAVEFTFLWEILFLLWRHFRRILITRHTARSELSASDLVLCEPFLLGIIARHLSPPLFKRLMPKYGRSLARQSL